jgi:hypothetical protein
MNFKNLFLTGLVTASCYAGYNPDGFMCTIIGEPTNFIKVRMKNPPIYMYLWDGTKGELTDTKIYLDTLDLFIKKNKDGTLYIQNTIRSKYISDDLNVGDIPDDSFVEKGSPIVFADDCLIHDSKDVPYDFSKYINTCVVKDLYESSHNFAVTKCIVKTVGFLLTCVCGPKIFLDDCPTISTISNEDHNVQ